MTAITPDPASLVTPRRPVRAARRAAVKIVSAVGVLLAAASVSLIAQILIPGDRATTILNLQNGQQQNYTSAELAPVNHEFGFDHPLVCAVPATTSAASSTATSARPTRSTGR